MKVLIVANNDIGLFKFRRELIQALVFEKYEVLICLPNGSYIPKLEQLGCYFIPCDFDRHGVNPISELKQLFFYRSLLERIKPNIVLTFTIKPNCYCGAACAALHIPYVANITGLGTSIENGGLMQKITLALYKRGLRSSKKVFFQNIENRNFMLSKGIVKGEYDMLPGSGVNLDQYRLLEYPKGPITDFVFISRIMKEKGIDQYLEAAIEIRKRYPETRFHVCGFCEQDYQKILKKLNETGTIVYHGLVDDIASIHSVSQCTIHPTYYPEGLSNVLLESCACGRPIITTDRSGCREVIEDGVNGYVVKERDSQDLIKKIEQFLSLSQNEREKMGLAGRQKVEKEFNRQIVVDKYLEVTNLDSEAED